MNSAIEQIRVSKARYCRYLDTKQWNAFAALFTEDATARIVAPDGGLIAAFDSASTFVGAARQFLENAQSIHQVHNDELAILSPNEITAIWSMEDYIVFPTASANEPASVHGYGHYHETWLRTDGTWRIARLELRRTIFETTSKTAASDLP
ncbi:3-phenylpropionate/cinnamic acid dioxygenase small subunit [Lysobacter niastensis]|uniref:3-phenylpropionate/cinnamic acid dioxygenase small subunit n=1 Tax=Lysobacter niastensis TaxID=380629 RepID=A0ABU1WAB3_9GAMM|nr:nuclear transport factor 2 family protein [Lysobacter niastensis]MDR7134387.1 3-phenylpropionate/cinnamic acid dioxygenase small subunit [Lysobacter niastensis]